MPKLKSGQRKKKKSATKKDRRINSNYVRKKSTLTCGVCGGDELNENLNLTKKLYCIYVCTTCTEQLVDKAKLKSLLGTFALKNNMTADKVVFSLKFSMLEELHDLIGVHKTTTETIKTESTKRLKKTRNMSEDSNLVEILNCYESDHSGDMSDHFDSFFDQNKETESVNLQPAPEITMEIDSFVCVDPIRIKDEPLDIISEDEMPLRSLIKQEFISSSSRSTVVVRDLPADETPVNDCPNISANIRDGSISPTTNFDDDFVQSPIKTEPSHQETPSKTKIEEMLRRKKEEQFCEVCGKFFKQVNSFKLHMEDHEKGISHKCDFCKQIFTTSIAKVKHMTKKHNFEAGEKDAVKKLSYECAECNKIFKYEDLLAAHNMKHHRDRCDEKTVKSFTCPFCAKVCVRRFQLKRHIQEVHASKCYTCEICAKQFTRERSFQSHLINVHQILKDRPKCEICGACFVTRNQLDRHVIQQHSKKEENNDKIKESENFVVPKNVQSAGKQKGHICKYCGEDVGSQWKRRAHYQNIHEDGKKPMRSCHICKMDFVSFKKFEAHIIAHNDPLICKVCGEFCHTDVRLLNHVECHNKIENDHRKYECDVCGKRLSTKHHIVVHMRNHNGNCPYVCETCGKAFKFPPCYSYHKLKCSGKTVEKRFVCQVCGKAFFSHHGLKEHQRVHTNERPFECRICKSTFMTKSVLNHHYQTHDETRKKVHCDICKKDFKFMMVLRAHDLKHHPEKFPFKCKICDAVFKNEGGLRSHMTTKHYDVK